MTETSPRAMRICRTIGEVRAARSRHATLGFVPTMGFLHAGHLSLVRQARAACGAVAVSIFVNPTQFGPNEDLSRYPRDLPRDLALLEAEGVDLVFVPEPATLYPAGFACHVEVGALGERLEGAVRPGHFNGMATVVLKLLNILQPGAVWFGQKDAQQCAIVRRMATDFDLPCRIEIGETVREPDGLALSSRNTYLSPEERGIATTLLRALEAARQAALGGERDAEVLRRLIRDMVGREPQLQLDYASIADAATMEELRTVTPEALALVAARLGRTRLLDNMRLMTPG
ncbi:pantoate--beta-alanine ligase [Roseomonas gilardii subsp. gilardii]|uniref:pantoate--beta-alanine ligase n=1 Tax=Roseomonas gilardii TaxID=257708 RepID=UPI001FF86BF7|nr:pantoate--beta-alanine ligase [Roseomonas gilardii]UPG71659.1 pantoate--beta-alanine ligase [Roseomonas gilardii subsp. gilardii]